MSTTKTVVTNSVSSLEADQIQQHLMRIRGQVEGIMRMYNDERECLEIARQIVAVRNALGRVARDLLSGEASRCSRERRPEDFDAILKELFR